MTCQKDEPPLQGEQLRLDIYCEVGHTFVPTSFEILSWMKKTLEIANKQQQHAQVQISFLAEDRIKKANLMLRKNNQSTNVLSSDYGEVFKEGDTSFLLWELLFGVLYIEKEIKEKALDSKAYWALLVVHGTLHLLGYTHDEDEDEEQMLSLEKKVLSSFNFSHRWI